LGPTALAVSPQGKLFVARYDFTEAENNGLISILTDSGDCEEELVVGDCAEITGLFFSKMQEGILYATEKSTNSLLKIQVSANDR